MSAEILSVCILRNTISKFTSSVGRSSGLCHVHQLSGCASQGNKVLQCLAGDVSNVVNVVVVVVMVAEMISSAFITAPLRAAVGFALLKVIVLISEVSIGSSTTS
eukprot:3089666-Amphidinium_carterae.1